MKIIDLLNKIANGEEVPNFKINDVKYCVTQDGYLQELYGSDVEWYIFDEWLNEEVQILEEVEDKEYEDIEEILNEELEECECLRDVAYFYQTRVNELIRNQKKILERLDK